MKKPFVYMDCRDPDDRGVPVVAVPADFSRNRDLRVAMDPRAQALVAAGLRQVGKAGLLALFAPEGGFSSEAAAQAAIDTADQLALL